MDACLHHLAYDEGPGRKVATCRNCDGVFESFVDGSGFRAWRRRST